MSDNKEVRFALVSDIEIAGQKFRAVIAKVEGGISLSGMWVGGDFSFAALAKEYGLGALPDFLNDFTPERITLAGSTADGSLLLALKVSKGTLEFSRKPENGAHVYGIDIANDNGMSLSDVPIIGGLLPDGTDFTLRKISLKLGAETRVDFDAVLNLGGSEIKLPYEKPETLPEEEVPDNSTASQSSNDGIKWINVNKSIKILRIERIGLALEKSSITAYLDAGLDISVVSITFYGLHLKIPLGGGSFGFGLQGAMVSVNLPMVKLSGGLYRDATSDFAIYNGMLKLQISDFCFTALGSYSEVKLENGGTAPSFFVYVLLQMPLGGPAFFFVTGLALGMGINREIVMPALEEIPEFPFVKAAMGGGGISDGDSPSVALNKLSDWIRPSEGAYFAAIGVKFTSFKIVNSFALLIAEFGKRTRITLLGQSVLTMPPNLKRSDNPLLYAELALRAVLDIDEGYFEVIASLTNNSYILHKDCKLQGGFMFCVWFTGERAGDFIISLGGCHHPLFKNKDKYPKISKVGINWQITPKLSFKGGGYMAVTPSCVMAGCDVSLDYRSGDLHAWLSASASFYMQWKPLFYDIQIGISVGVSYSIFSMELSCGLHLRGPEFAGELYIKVFFVSFNVRFGAWDTKPEPLTWNEFSKAFLPKKDSAPATYALSRSGDGHELTGASVREGVIREGVSKPDGEDRLYVRPFRLRLSTNSVMPCTGFSFNGREISAELTKPFIAPMKPGTTFKHIHRVTLTDASGNRVNTDMFQASCVTESMSPSLWGEELDINAPPIKNLGAGLDIALCEPEVFGTLPEAPSKGYRLSVLEDKATRFYNWGKVEEAPVAGEVFSAFVKNQDTAKQNARLAEMSMVFGTADSVRYREIREKPKDYYWSSFYVCRTGQRISRKESEKL